MPKQSLISVLRKKNVSQLIECMYRDGASLNEILDAVRKKHDANVTLHNIRYHLRQKKLYDKYKNERKNRNKNELYTNEVESAIETMYKQGRSYKEILDVIAKKNVFTTQNKLKHFLAQKGITKKCKVSRMKNQYVEKSREVQRRRKKTYDDPIVLAAVVRFLQKESRSVDDVADLMGGGTKNALMVLSHLESIGYNIQKQGDLWSIGKTAFPKEDIVHISRKHRYGGKSWKFGIVSDTHLCSKHQRLDILEEAYDTFKQENISIVFHAGNIVDGYSSYINHNEVLYTGVTDQALYCLDNYPQREGITTYFISGECHEGWWYKREGLIFGDFLMAEGRLRGREDLVHAGMLEKDFVIDKNVKGEQTILRLFHAGGGTAYAQSYQAQKIVESYQGGEKPQILIIGHYHKLNCFFPRNVHTVNAGCMQDQSMFMRKLHIEAQLGYAVIDVTTDTSCAVSKFTYTPYPYFDKKYHQQYGKESYDGSKYLITKENKKFFE